ncbi:MAG: hypothetical protein H0T71_10105 [Acidobacteria bacterium]|nr:hypothetical protein [Acidobacteriota bacterium]
MTMFALLVTTGCGGSDPSGPLYESLAENHPAATDSASEAAAVWSADGTELLYILPDRTTLVARNVATGVRRVLYVANAADRVQQVELSPDGSEFFTLATRFGQTTITTIRRHNAALTEVITDRGRFLGVDYGKQRDVSVAKNGDFAYIVRPESLFVRRKGATTAQFIGVDCKSIAAVAPAADGFLCYNHRSGYTVTRFTTSASAPIVINPGESRIHWTIWDIQGISFVRDTKKAYSESYTFERYSDPASRFVTLTYSRPEHLGNSVSLSADGHSFAYANFSCAESSGLFSCSKTQLFFYIADGLSRTTKRIAVHTALASPTVTIAPDGSRIAYQLNGQLYILSAR